MAEIFKDFLFFDDYSKIYLSLGFSVQTKTMFRSLSSLHKLHVGLSVRVFLGLVALTHMTSGLWVKQWLFLSVHTVGQSVGAVASPEVMNKREEMRKVRVRFVHKGDFLSLCSASKQKSHVIYLRMFLDTQ